MVLGVPELDRRNLMFMAGFGALTVAIPFPKAAAAPSQPAPASPAPSAQTPAYVFADEFDGPAGSAPDPSKWMIAQARERQQQAS